MVCGAILEGLGMEIAGHLEYVVTYITAIWYILSTLGDLEEI
jgi:hypothetical protein